MSIKLFSHGVVDGYAGTGTMKYAEYVVRLGVRRQGNGRVVTKDVPFALGGLATADEAGLHEAAIQMAERIAKLSKGVVMNLFQKLGKYRNDELPEIQKDTAITYGICALTNDERIVDPEADAPRVSKSARVFIPWLHEEVSRQDLKATLTDPVTVGGDDFFFAISRFQDVEKSAVEGYMLPYSAGTIIKDMDRVPNFALTNDDVSLGGSDGIVSEAYATVTPGDDDL